MCGRLLDCRSNAALCLIQLGRPDEAIAECDAALAMPCADCRLHRLPEGPNYVLTTPVLMTVENGVPVTAGSVLQRYLGDAHVAGSCAFCQTEWCRDACLPLSARTAG